MTIASDCEVRSLVMSQSTTDMGLYMEPSCNQVSERGKSRVHDRQLTCNLVSQTDILLEPSCNQVSERGNSRVHERQLTCNLVSQTDILYTHTVCSQPATGNQNVRPAEPLAVDVDSQLKPSEFFRV